MTPLPPYNPCHNTDTPTTRDRAVSDVVNAATDATNVAIVAVVKNWLDGHDEDVVQQLDHLRHEHGLAAIVGVCWTVAKIANRLNLPGLTGLPDQLAEVVDAVREHARAGTLGTAVDQVIAPVAAAWDPALAALAEALLDTAAAGERDQVDALLTELRHGIELRKTGTIAPVDLVVRTENARMLDQTVQQLPGVTAVLVEGSWDPQERTCRLRVFANLRFLKFALANQGYGQVVAEMPVTDILA